MGLVTGSCPTLLPLRDTSSAKAESNPRPRLLNGDGEPFKIS